MKQAVIFGLMILASTSIASAHGFHAEVFEAVEHVRIHLIENGVSLVVSTLVIIAAYAMYRKVKKSEQA